MARRSVGWRVSFSPTAKSCRTASTRIRRLTQSRRSRKWKVEKWISGGLLALTAVACGNGQQKQVAASALVHDISGVWAGPALPTLQEAAPFTPAGKERYDANKATWGPNAVGLAESNDPLITCDP